MKNIGKIFDFKDRQVVVLKSYNDEAESYEFHFLFDIENGVRAELKFGFDTENARDKSFDKLDSKKVETTVNDVVNSLNSN